MRKWPCGLVWFLVLTFTLMAAGGSVLAASSKRALACAYELMSERRGAVRWLRQRAAFRREAIISCGAGYRVCCRRQRRRAAVVGGGTRTTGCQWLGIPRPDSVHISQLIPVRISQLLQRGPSCPSCSSFLLLLPAPPASLIALLSLLPLTSVVQKMQAYTTDP